MKKGTKEKEINTEWNLSLLYKSASDPKIEADVAAIELAYDSFQKKYQNKTDYIKDENALFSALTEYENMFGKLQLTAPYNYFSYRKDLNSKDNEAESHINILSERLTKATNKILFFELALARIETPIRETFLKSKKLQYFWYFLKVIFDQGIHNLTEAEEKIMNLKDHPSYSLWVNATDKMLGKQTVKYKGKEIALAEATSLIASSSTPERKKLHDMVIKKLVSISDFAENELNAIVLNKKVNDELRHYPEPYSSTLLGYQNDQKTILNLVDVVTKSNRISHRFYNLKAKLLKMKKLGYQDRAASVGIIKGNFDFKEGLSILQKSFEKVDPFYAETLKKFISRGQIDVYPKIGKIGGAYCSGNANAPTFVLLNYINNFDSVMTFAHEMGHAIHSELSKMHQKSLYERYTISTAEVASTFFENFAFEELFERLSDKEKTVALHDRINDDIQTIFRQIALFNFELELHRTIREKGSLPKEGIAKLMNKHMQNYLGPAFKLNDEDGYFFVSWSHIRYFFYVYSYAFGQLISKALYKNIKKDKAFGAKIKQFLSAGGSKSPEDIFKDIGIDVTKPEFFADGLKSIEEDIARLEKLTSK